jgi:hypothetical protein
MTTAWRCGCSAGPGKRRDKAFRRSVSRDAAFEWRARTQITTKRTLRTPLPSTRASLRAPLSAKTKQKKNSRQKLNGRLTVAIFISDGNGKQRNGNDDSKQ